MEGKILAKRDLEKQQELPLPIKPEPFATNH